MADDVLTRNSADELALRVAQSSGDTGINKDDVYTRDSQGRLAVRIVGSGGGGGGADYSAEIKALENAVSVLATSVDLTTEIGGKTTVALGDLTAMDVDGRPSYKQAGATVYADNGVVGIIDSVDSTNAIITTVQTADSVVKGHTWTKVPLLNPDTYNSEGLVASMGNLSDGVYEFFIKNPTDYEGGQNVFLLRFKIVNGELDIPQYSDSYSSYYYPMVSLSKGVSRNFYADTNFSSLPTIFSKIGDSFVYVGNIGYSGGVPGGCVPNYVKEKYFEVSDIKNVETGEFLPLESAVVYTEQDWQQYINDNQLVDKMNYRGVNPFYKEVDLYSVYTCQNRSVGIYQGQKYLRIGIPKVLLDLYSAQVPQISGYVYNAFPREVLLCLCNREDSETHNDWLCVKAQFIAGAEDCKMLKATGVFGNIRSVKLFYDPNNYYDAILYFEFENEFVESKEFEMGVSIYGVTYYNDIIAYGETERPSDYVEIKDFPINKVPTSTSSEYVITNAGGLIEMGGIVSINETLQPDVALGNVPVVFQNELGNANFVPTITVMTDGTFKRVMADVANPTTTGFDLCVRNVDTEAVSNIKIAWKIVGTK